MPDVEVKIKKRNVKSLSLEQVQSAILWVYGAFLRGRTRSPSFFVVRNVEHVESTNLVFVENSTRLAGAEKSRLIDIAVKKSRKTNVVLRERVSLETVARLILADVDRTEINYENAAVTRDNIEMFVTKNVQLVFGSHKQTIPTDASVVSFDHSDFIRFTGISPHFLVALDCEMVETKAGSEVGRVSVVDHNYNTLYDKYVRPENEIIDYLTEHSGLTAENIATGIALEDAHADLKAIIGKDTVILGHSLESDFVALRVYHESVIDTSHVFRTTDNKRLRLKSLALHYLNATTQVGSHCSVEDAKSCIGLLRYKIEEMAVLERSTESMSVPAKKHSLRVECSRLGAEAVEIKMDSLADFLCDGNLNTIFVAHRDLPRLLKHTHGTNSVFFYFYTSNGNVHVLI